MKNMRTGIACQFDLVSFAALEGYLYFGNALCVSRLCVDPEQLALVVAECNTCNDCGSTYISLGGKVGLTEKGAADGRPASAVVQKIDAVLKLARSIIVQRKLSDADLNEARTSGLADDEIVETVANVVLNVFSTYVNQLAPEGGGFAGTQEE